MRAPLRSRFVGVFLVLAATQAFAGERQGGITAAELQRAAPHVKSPAALDTLHELGRMHGAVHDLDVEVASRKLPPAAAKSVQRAWRRIQALKRQGAIVSYENETSISPEMLTRLDQHVDVHEKAALEKIAYADLARLSSTPHLKTLALQRLRLAHGVHQTSLVPTPPALSLHETDGRLARAAQVVLVTDDTLNDAARGALVEIIGEHGDEGDVPLLKQLERRTPYLSRIANRAMSKIALASNMTVAFATWEAKPYAGSGGLGNVMQELPTALAKMGHSPVVVMPRHQKIDRNKLSDTGVTVWIDEPNAPREPVKVFFERRDGVVYLFAENGKYLSDNRPGLYGDSSGREYGDNAERYDFFGAAVPAILRAVAEQRPDLVAKIPDVVQLNDAHTASAAYALKNDDAFARSATVYAVHNLGDGYQGRFDAQHLPNLRFGKLFAPSPGHTFGQAEHNGQINFAKLGIEESDAVIPVSRGYAAEITTAKFGGGLHGVAQVAKAQGRLFGNLNGIDPTVWDPRTDRLVPHAYDLQHLEGKAANKAELQKTFSLPKSDTAVIGVVARVTEQKGFDDVIVAIESSIAKKQKVQYVVMGDGDPEMVAKLKALAIAHPTVVSFSPFSSEKEHLLYAGSDLFLMPSKFEPSGLPQMYALRYLTIPIVRAVGGLEESIAEWNPQSGSGNGFKFTEGVAGAVDRALGWYASPDRQRLLRNAALADFDWETTSAPEQLALYRKVLNQKRP